MSSIRKILGENIRRLRNSHEWTQVYLADCLEITTSFLNMIESGKRGMSLDLIEKISDLFGVPVASLFIDVMESSSGKNYLRNAELNSLETKLTRQITKLIKNSVDELRRF